MRNALWRSIPLACINLYLAFRNLLELPFCQSVGIGDAAFFTLRGGRGPFIEALEDGGINVSQLAQVQALQKFTPQQVNQSLDGKFWGAYSKTVDDLWKSAHCRQSGWRAENKPRSKDYAQSWFGINPVVSLKDGDTGNAATGNLLTVNVQMYELVWQKVSHNQDAIAGARFLLWKSGSWTQAIGSSTLTDQELVDRAVASFRESFDDTPEFARPARSFQQFRSTVPLWRAAALLGNSILPIVKHAHETTRLQGMLPKCLVAAHFALDVLLLTTALVVSFVGPVAHKLGTYLEDQPKSQHI